METIQGNFDYSKRENRMGEARKDALRLNFARKLNLEFNGGLLDKNCLGKEDS